MRASRNWRRFVVAVASILACQSLQNFRTEAYAADTPLISSMAQAGAAKIALAAAPPWAFILPSGEAQGYLVDVTGELMKALGVGKLQPVATTWDAMIPGLQAKQFDLIPAGLNITAARCQVVAFSAPISVHQDGLYLTPGNPKSLTGYDSVAKSPDVKLTVLAGSSQEAYAQRRGVKADQRIRVPDIQAGIAAVKGDRAAAFAVGQFSVTNPAQRGVELVVDKVAPLQGIGIAFRKEDAPSRDAINAQLMLLKSNGRLRELYEKKYGFPNWDQLERTSTATDVEPGCS
jgi:polar amino acid transport system substrate-binding protein